MEDSETRNLSQKYSISQIKSACLCVNLSHSLRKV